MRRSGEIRAVDVDELGPRGGGEHAWSALDRKGRILARTRAARGAEDRVRARGGRLRDRVGEVEQVEFEGRVRLALVSSRARGDRWSRDAAGGHQAHQGVRRLRPRQSKPGACGLRRRDRGVAVALMPHDAHDGGGRDAFRIGGVFLLGGLALRAIVARPQQRLERREPQFADERH
ncbi:hypothetical protein SLNSH_23940 [Alsobacter soli]|uniref:Uncharacterized protein n=1 Tax=Alsobacter soli TaxID=2109933 RepID=A0A2T1HLC4_9HYPH|nr:hypothetical protein SLNSH_23940 [Alsobacter soli]